MIPQAEVGLRKVGVVQGGVPPALRCDWTPERWEQLLIKAPLTNRIAQVVLFGSASFLLMLVIINVDFLCSLHRQKSD